MIVNIVGQMSEEIFALNGPDREPVLNTNLKATAGSEGQRVCSAGGLRIRFREVAVESVHATDNELPIEGKPPHGVKRVTRASHIGNQAEALLRLWNMVRSTAGYLGDRRDVLPDVEQLFAAAAVQQKAAAGSRGRVADHCGVVDRERDRVALRNRWPQIASLLRSCLSRDGGHRSH